MASARTYALRKSGMTIVERVALADGIWSRTRGLLGVRRLGPNRGLLLAPCSAVHTFFMRFPLDLFFLDHSGLVVRIVRDLVPFRFAQGGALACSVLEIESGWLSPDRLQAGDRTELVSHD